MKTLPFPAALLVTCLAALLWAQDDMPEAPGKAMTVQYCTQCHPSDMFSGTRNNSNGWDQTMATMTEKGITWASDADYATVLNYLSTCLGPALKTVNINKAAACEIAKMLAISPQQADAIVACREKNGAFKDLDGVKKVEGLDPASLDAKKDTITF
jgi:competence ComEA-like helix-hairpin-helix protein